MARVATIKRRHERAAAMCARRRGSAAWRIIKRHRASGARERGKYLVTAQRNDIVARHGINAMAAVKKAGVAGMVGRRGKRLARHLNASSSRAALAHQRARALLL